MKTTTYDQDLKDAVKAVSEVMDEKTTTSDSIEIHVNHWGRWVAKYRTLDGSIFYAFGDDLLEALTKLKESPNK